MAMKPDTASHTRDIGPHHRLGEGLRSLAPSVTRYVAVLEAHIEKALAARVVGLDFSAFCAELLERGPSALGEQLNLDVLGSFGFEGFKVSPACPLHLVGGVRGSRDVERRGGVPTLARGHGYRDLIRLRS